MLVRRRIAAGVGVVLLIVIVLLVNGCLKRGKQQALESYNQNVNQIGQSSESQTARPLFTTLSDASGKSALDVEVQVDQLRRQAQELAERAKGLSVPSQMTSAQRNLLSALNLRVEGLSKIAGQVREALGGQAQQASTKIAGAMETFLASDILYSQRVVPANTTDARLRRGQRTDDHAESLLAKPRLADAIHGAIEAHRAGD